MTFLAKHIESILSIDRPSLIVILVFCAMAAYVLKDYLANPQIALLVFPLLVAFSVLAQYIFIVLETYPIAKLDQWLMWTIMAAIIGTIIGTGLVACIVHLRERLGNRPT